MIILRRCFATLPRALREQVWLCHNGPVFSAPCHVSWCQNEINVFDFTAGHNLARSKGGRDTLDNLRPICPRCNSSMGNKFTIDEWDDAFSSH